MATNGTYGTKRPAFITSDDVDIFYNYRPNRNTDSSDFVGFKKLDSNILSTVSEESGSILPGIYSLNLPLDDFGTAGLYSIYIKPKEITSKIIDVSTLAAYPDIRGIVIAAGSTATTDSSIFTNGGLTGYRVEYFDDNGERLSEYRIITSSNRCEPIAQNLNDSTQKGIRYRFNDSSNLLFCTLTPSVAMSFRSSALPNIGKTNQVISLINTKFNPIMIEVELTEHDIETVSMMLENDQVRNLNEGLITTFDNNGNVYHQASYGHIVNKETGLNADFKLKEDGTLYKSESDKLQEIKKNI